MESALSVDSEEFVMTSILSPPATYYGVKKSLKALKLSADKTPSKSGLCCDLELDSSTESLVENKETTMTQSEDSVTENILDFLLDNDDDDVVKKMPLAVDESVDLIKFDVEGQLIDLSSDSSDEDVANQSRKNDCIDKAFENVCFLNAKNSNVSFSSLLENCVDNKNELEKHKEEVECDKKETECVGSAGADLFPTICSQSSVIPLDDDENSANASIGNELSTFPPLTIPNNSVDSSIAKNSCDQQEISNCDLINCFNHCNCEKINQIDWKINREPSECKENCEKCWDSGISSNQCQSFANLSHEEEKICCKNCIDQSKFECNCECENLINCKENCCCERLTEFCPANLQQDKEPKKNFHQVESCHHNHQHHFQHLHHCNHYHFPLCHQTDCEHQQQQHPQQIFDSPSNLIKRKNIDFDSLFDAPSKISDSNNNKESVCNQNRENLWEKEGELRSKGGEENLGKDIDSKDFSFLSNNTSQRTLPPNWLSSEASDFNCFEGSQRLKRLEERFKGFSYTKKLLRNSKLFSKSEEILTSCDSNNNHENSLTCRSSPLNFQSRSKSKSENCLQQEDSNNNYRNFNSLQVEQENTKKSLSVDSLGEKFDELNRIHKKYDSLLEFLKQEKLSECEVETNNNIKNNNSNNTDSVKEEDKSQLINGNTSPESSAESDEICKIFRENCEPKYLATTDVDSNSSFVFYEVDEEEEGQTKNQESIPPDANHSGSEDSAIVNDSLYNDIFTNCEFDVSSFENYVQELKQHNVVLDPRNCIHNSENNEDNSDESDFFCDCLVEAVPLYHPSLSIMRETTGPLRGLLKKPNRPPPLRKNRVVFDETRNEFFEADYIILIREDCPYDEDEENEPCTCGDHELVRICCDEGCNCGYVDDGRTPPVSK
jgi:hypothetical protein